MTCTYERGFSQKHEIPEFAKSYIFIGYFQVGCDFQSTTKIHGKPVLVREQSIIESDPHSFSPVPTEPVTVVTTRSKVPKAPPKFNTWMHR